jgi:hypothetical protein
MEKCLECNTNDIPDPEYCCNGYMCGCMGLPIDPPYCDECWTNKNITKGEMKSE